MTNVKVVGDWPLPAEWLNRLTSAVKRQFDVADVDLVMRNDPSAQYVLLVEKGPPVRLNVNLAERWAVEELFKGGYVEAAVKHESMHIKGDITFRHGSLAAPRAVEEKFGEALWRRISQLLTDMLVLLLNEVYAVAITPRSDAAKYLDYELWKLIRRWGQTDRREVVKANWILQAALLESLSRGLEIIVPDGLSAILAVFKRDMHDEAVLNQAERLFESLWNAVKAAGPIKDTEKRQFDIVAESLQLSQLLTIQRKPLFEED